MADSSLGHGPPIPPAGPFVFVDHWMESEQQQREMYEYRKEMHTKFAAMAGKIGCSSPQMGLAWLMAHDLVPIFSATEMRFPIDDIESVNFISAVKQAEKEIAGLTEEYRQGLWDIIRRYNTKAKW
jgi:aryl-alcohol dehydrogenase-like predicted oxidoreductase